jgi:hypothetical protein
MSDQPETVTVHTNRVHCDGADAIRTDGTFSRRRWVTRASISKSTNVGLWIAPIATSAVLDQAHAHH